MELEEQAEKLGELRNEMNAKRSRGRDLLGRRSFDLVGGITGSAKGRVTLTVWKREVA